MVCNIRWVQSEWAAKITKAQQELDAHYLQEHITMMTEGGVEGGDTALFRTIGQWERMKLALQEERHHMILRVKGLWSVHMKAFDWR